MNPRRLYRSRDRQLAGVAGGMAEYLDIDPTVVRILWIIVAIASGGLVLLAYLVLALVIPQAPYATAPGAAAGWATAGAPAGASAGWSTPPGAPVWDPDPIVNSATEARTRQRTESRGIGAGAIIGVVLVVVGMIALANVVLPGWVSGAILGPAVILTLGAALVVSSIRRDNDASDAAAVPTGFAASTGSAPPSGPVATARAWDVTDTQSVDQAVYAPTAGTAVDPSDEGALPA